MICYRNVQAITDANLACLRPQGPRVQFNFENNGSIATKNYPAYHVQEVVEHV